MDYTDLEHQSGDVFKDLVAKPFLYGIGFGLGYCLAVIILEHPWNADLLKHVRELVRTGKVV